MCSFLNENKKIDVVYTAYSRIDETRKITASGLIIPPKYLGYRGNVISPCFLFRQHVYDLAGPYNDDLFLAEDYFFWLCAAQRSKFSAYTQL